MRPRTAMGLLTMLMVGCGGGGDPAPGHDAGGLHDGAVANDGGPDGGALDDGGGSRADAGGLGDAGAEGDAGAALDAGNVEADAGDPSDGGATGQARWYDSREPLALAITAPLGAAFSAAFAGSPDGIFPPVRSKEPFAGTLSYAFPGGTQHSSELVLSVRGNSSLQECAFPKLKLAFAERVVDEADTFVQTKKIKLGTHCGEEETVNGNIGRLRNELAAWREEVVYQLARAMSITIMQTRPATVTFTDTSPEPAFASPLTRKAFLLEHIDELARRLGATALPDPVDCGPDAAARPDALAVLRVKMFHALVGNWDWWVGPPESGGCGSLGNTEVLVHADGSLTLVPADFDLAAFVVGQVRNPETNQPEPITADNALASARAYLGPSIAGESEQAVAAIKAEYVAKRAALQAVIDASLMDAEGKRAGRLLLDGFIAALAE